MMNTSFMNITLTFIAKKYSNQNHKIMPQGPNNKTIIAKTPPLMLAWFAAHKRPLLWREARTPYKVWLAEVMLQQTTVTTATGYFTRFLARFPTLESLAAAPLDDILHMWQGLGYYSRARNLHNCARTVVDGYGGDFPATAPELEKLPGIGPYTAAAVACIAFDEPTPVVDGNIERVISRLFAIKTPLPKSKPEIKKYAATLTPQKQSGDYAEAMMDLGATICTPRGPKCGACPLEALCKARHMGIQEILPKKEKKKPSPEKTGTVYAFFAPDGTLYIQKRGEKGLLAGLWELPHKNWEPDHMPDFSKEIDLHKTETVGQIRHVFTHFRLTLNIEKITLENKPKSSGEWVKAEQVKDYALPTLMKKITDLLT